MPITVVSVEPIDAHVRRDVAIISSLGEHRAGQYVLVRVADENGHVGLGEASVTSIWSGETQAGAAQFPTACLVNAVEAFENSRLILGPDAYARVFYANENMAILLFR